MEMEQTVSSDINAPSQSKLLQALRREYESADTDMHIPDEPMRLFSTWFDEAVQCKIADPNAMCLSTVSKEGAPSSRMVLMKGYDADGITFFTNYESRKGREIIENPKVSLVFYWADMHRQIRIEGEAVAVSKEESLAYYSTRPRDARIGAWASRQSTELVTREQLQDRVAEFTEKFATEEAIPLPPYWGGFKIFPTCVEFWRGRQSRLHDRVQFRKLDNVWAHRFLSP
eukprot:TRINITY_DN9902_c0_g1_i1.p1 TRINITY_DN9902_c0_g1~~TRINITY_DN9902_c0_g1_i1.p1  ORF type:complete len:229 (+),score=22.69 TRINITY_DN9902_c0_g1_i1:78-764(+)